MRDILICPCNVSDNVPNPDYPLFYYGLRNIIRESGGCELRFTKETISKQIKKTLKIIRS